MSSQLETVGKTAGTVYFTSTFGGIAATFFFGLYFIPVAGLRWCAIVTGLALAALPVVYIVKRVFGGPLRSVCGQFDGRPVIPPSRDYGATSRPGYSRWLGFQRAIPRLEQTVGASPFALSLWEKRTRQRQ